jgi:hypothetical protein
VRITRALYKPEPPQRDPGVVEPFETFRDRIEVQVILVGLVLYLDVVAVERDVTADELDLPYTVVAG